MKLSQRYKRLNIWNKYAFWVSNLSLLVGIIYLITLIHSCIYPSTGDEITYSTGDVITYNNNYYTSVDSANEVEAFTNEQLGLSPEDTRRMLDRSLIDKVYPYGWVLIAGDEKHGVFYNPIPEKLWFDTNGARAVINDTMITLHMPDYQVKNVSGEQTSVTAIIRGVPRQIGAVAPLFGAVGNNPPMAPRAEILGFTEKGVVWIFGFRAVPE